MPAYTGATTLPVIGPNGGGKSTLIKLMTGLLSPDSGRISIAGKSPRAARSLVGYVPQYVNFDALFPSTVEEAVLTGTLVKGWGFYSRENRNTAREALELVGLEKDGHRSFSAISGGQRQRTLIARGPCVATGDSHTGRADVQRGPGGGAPVQGAALPPEQKTHHYPRDP